MDGTLHDGLVRTISYSGQANGHEVSIVETGGGAWFIRFTVPEGFSDSDDFEGEVDSLEKAFAAFDAYRSGTMPDVMRNSRDLREEAMDADRTRP
jgi:hypothetical protein